MSLHLINIESAPNRVAARTGGGYVIYNADGQYVGHTACVSAFNHSQPGMRATAARMAYNQELHLICQAVDLDFENTGTVTSQVVEILREVLSQVAAA